MVLVDKMKSASQFSLIRSNIERCILSVLIGLLFLFDLNANVLAGERDDAWYKNSHFVGETYPEKSKVLRLLGNPDRQIDFVFEGGGSSNSLIQCKRPAVGTRIVGFFYSLESKEVGYWLFFHDNELLCFSGRTSFSAQVEWSGLEVK